MKDFKSVTKAIAQHGLILWKGFIRVLYGALTAGLMGLAVYGFAMIPNEGGYIAVFEFVGAIATSFVAVVCMYQQGAGKKRGAKK